MRQAVRAHAWGLHPLKILHQKGAGGFALEQCHAAPA
jgi:hypothetical protein